uniref:non-specific serine/threonine protein kinase n=1 Tax=Anthurium amnicola TaxID=1678845 RepID=A0A1D1Y0H1_9ARAE
MRPPALPCGSGHKPPIAFPGPLVGHHHPSPLPSMETELDFDNLTALRVLGMGAMGTVFLVADPSPTAPAPFFALKVVDVSQPGGGGGGEDRRARWEVSVLSRLSHPFLPTLLGRVETPSLLGWALPYCPGGDLNALRQSLPDGVFSPSAIRFYLSELLLALAHLHSLGIVYRDLKPENVLLQASGHLTLTDFDLSRQLSPRASYPAARPPPEPKKKKKKGKSARVSPVSRRVVVVTGGERSNSFVGTEEYVAPEVVRGEGHEFAVDWWAMGVLAYEMSYGRTPFRGRNRKETFANILSRQPEFSGWQRYDELTDLVQRLLAKDPTRRLGFHGGAEEVMAHPFFRCVRWDLLAQVARPPFLPHGGGGDEDHLAASVAAGGGFSVGDYFKKLRQQLATLGSPSSSSSSDTSSLRDF